LKSQKHYHIICGFHGCLPEMNEVYTSIQSVREALKEYISELRSSGNKFAGNLKHGYFECIKKEDILGDYFEISICYQTECLKSEEFTEIEN